MVSTRRLPLASVDRLQRLADAWAAALAPYQSGADSVFCSVMGLRDLNIAPCTVPRYLKLQARVAQALKFGEDDQGYRYAFGWRQLLVTRSW